MKEYTICESFSKPDSPYGILLDKAGCYGAFIGDFLSKSGLLCRNATVCEVGGGYGSLMHGLLNEYSDLIDRVYMFDLSKGLLGLQRNYLRQWSSKITFVNADIHEMIEAVRGVDLLIMNEVMGDLDTITDIDPGSMPEEVERIIQTYHLETPPHGPFSLNIGAIRLVEAICRKGIPAFLSEHSSDPIIPEDMDYLKRDLMLDSYPREIKLFKHSEYTIRFSHLIKIAEAHGRTVQTGALLDLIPIRKTAALRMIFLARACAEERQEIIFELLDHIREYRWLSIR